MAESPRIYSVDEALDLSLEETLVDVIAAYKLPRNFTKAEGIRLRDDEGNEYLDFLCRYGALALGHNNPEVIAAVDRARGQPNFFVISPGTMAAIVGAAALAAINLTVREDLPSRATELGKYFRGRLDKLREEFDLLKEVRGVA